jgi:hypothetical protein
MKILTLFLISMIAFSASAVFACDGPGDKDKDDQTFTVDAQYLCGGSECGKPKPAPEPEPQCGGSCGGDKDKKPAPEPELMCGGSGCGSGGDKD